MTDKTDVPASTDLIVPGPPPTPPALIFGTDADFTLAVWTSLPSEDRARTIELLQGNTAKPLADMIGQTIKVEHVLAHRIELLDEDTGELDAADRFVLVSPDGTAYAAVSRGIRKSLQLIMAMYGMPKWKPALTVKVNQISTRKGRRTFTLTPVDSK